MILKLSIQESLSGVTCPERGAHGEDPGQLYRRMVGEPGGKRLNRAALNERHLMTPRVLKFLIPRLRVRVSSTSPGVSPAAMVLKPVTGTFLGTEDPCFCCRVTEEIKGQLSKAQLGANSASFDLPSFPLKGRCSQRFISMGGRAVIR